MRDVLAKETLPAAAAKETLSRLPRMHTASRLRSEGGKILHANKIMLKKKSRSRGGALEVFAGSQALSAANAAMKAADHSDAKRNLGGRSRKGKSAVCGRWSARSASQHRAKHPPGRYSSLTGGAWLWAMVRLDGALWPSSCERSARSEQHLRQGKAR